MVWAAKLYYIIVLYYKHLIIISKVLMENILDWLHRAYQGTSNMLLRESECCLWPGLSNNIQSQRCACNQCCLEASNHPTDPLHRYEDPKYQLQQLMVDYFEVKGRQNLKVNTISHKFGENRQEFFWRIWCVQQPGDRWWATV